MLTFSYHCQTERLQRNGTCSLRIPNTGEKHTFDEVGLFFIYIPHTYRYNMKCSYTYVNVIHMHTCMSPQLSVSSFKTLAVCRGVDGTSVYAFKRKIRVKMR